MHRKARIYLPVVGGLFILLIVRQPLVRSAAADALTLCAATLLPALLPLSVTAKLFLLLGLHTPLARLLARPLRRCFRLPPAAAGPLLVGLLGGYPLGAQALSDAVQRGELPRADALRLSRFCNQPGPAFLIGAIGLSLFGSVGVGLALWGTQLLSACCVALLFRGRSLSAVSAFPKPRRAAVSAQSVDVSFGDALTEAVRSSCQNLLTVCGFVVFVAVLRGLLNGLPGIDALGPLPAALLNGALELAGGLFALQELTPFFRFVLAAALSAWGGLCVQLQAMTPLRGAGLPGGPMLLGKLCQAALSVPFSVCFAVLLRLPGAPDALPKPEILCVFSALLLLFCIFLPKYWKKRSDPVIIEKKNGRPRKNAAAASAAAGKPQHA